MPGSGLWGSFGIASESTYGTPVAVSRFYEIASSTMAAKTTTFQGEGLRAGQMFPLAARRGIASRQAAGDVIFDLPVKGLGLILSHAFGSSPTPTAVGSLYQQIHNWGSTFGKSFTAQVVKPSRFGTAAQDVFTYPGCKITDWTLTAIAGKQITNTFTIDAADEATPSNAFAPTTLSAATTAGAASFTTVASIPAGSYVVVDSGVNAEVVQTGTPTGAGPYTIPVTAAEGSAGTLLLAHASGVTVSSATGLNYGAATALQTQTYPSQWGLFSFKDANLLVGGTLTQTGAWSVAGAKTAANVKSITIKAARALEVNDFTSGTPIKREPIDNAFVKGTLDIDADFDNQLLYQAYLSQTPLVLQATFVAPQASLVVTVGAGFQQDSSPQLSGPAVLTQKITFDITDPGGGALQAVYTSTDSVL